MTPRNLALSILFVLGIASPAYAADFLTPDEIKATFGTGVPFKAESAGGSVNMLTLQTDGTAEIVRKGKKTGIRGKWHVSSDGYCSSSSEKPENCFLIKKVGNKYEVMTSKKGLVAHWTK